MGRYISQYGGPFINRVYIEKNGMVLIFAEQILYSPNSLDEIRGKQSYKYAVTGIDTPTITTFEFWS